MKFLTLGVVAARVGGSAFAQPNAPGSNVPPSTPGYTMDKSGDAAERGRQAKLQRPQGGDAARSVEISGVPNDRSAISAQKRVQSRDERRPSARRTTQGGTPDDPLALAK
ncbi:MAG: hypothetical protein JSS56_21385 [Proteobacteria bacterium]|nr:hypothetical protein [Pseudomonadota bacterium]